MPEVWHEGGVQVQPFSPLNVDQGEGCSANGEAGQRGVPDPLQLWESLHWRDQAEVGNQAEGTPRCLRTQSLQRSAVAEHAWVSHHHINWKDTSVIDWARRPEELLLKEAIHIQGTPAGECLNRDGGKGIPWCWKAALKRSEGTANRQPNLNFRRQVTASGDSQ